jgi:serine-type D-Ala-D-Ala carboxypeptidase/endopeptidase (penicillin-binding protein 4)
MKARAVFYLTTLALLFTATPVLSNKNSKHGHSRHSSTAQTPSFTSVSGVYGTAQLSNQLDYLVSTNSPNASIGVYVKSMKYGDPLYSRNIHQPMTPASTMKIMTAEAALLYLGPDYRFSTQLLTDAKSVSNGVLQGNLYVVLSGDPSLNYDDLYDLLESLRSQQIQAIAGNVYIDNTAYDQRFYGPGWIWNDKKFCYGAPISASIINHNCPPVKVMSSNVSKRKVNGHSSRVRRPSVWTVNKVVTDVPDYNRTLFKGLLNQMGVRVYGSVTFGSAPEKLSLVSAHSSKPLRELLTDMLKKSDNIIAGAVFKKIGQLYNRQPGSWENSSYAVSQILSNKASVNLSGMRILDGSGLSPDNLATPAQMMQVLDYAYHHNDISYDFISALPISGVDGTLKHRMGNITRKVRAKTGTISGVVSLTGYTVTADKEPVAFVIMINGYKGMGWRYKAMEDKIVTSLTKYKR